MSIASKLTQPAEGAHSDLKSDGRKWQIFLVTAGSSYSPLIVWANAGERPVLLTLLLTILLLVGFGLLVWWVLVRLSLDGLGAAFAVMLFMVMVTNVGSTVGKYHVLDRFALFVLSMLAGALAYRLRRLGPLKLLMAWAAVFLIAYPVATLVSQVWWSGDTTINVDGGTEVEMVGMAERPDLLIVVFDGYGSTEVLEEFYGFDNTEFLDALAGSGFHAPGSIVANYARTQLSITSLLQLDYVTLDGKISGTDLDALVRVVNGESRLVEAFTTNGYRHVYVESGWLGSRCNDVTVDICVRAPWPDETFFDVSNRTILRGLPGFELGRPFTEGALRSADWLMDDLYPYLEDDVPDLIFAHVLLPHPPLFVDRTCVPDWRNGQVGFAVGRPDFDDAMREDARRGYLQQVECVNRIASRVAQLLPQQTAAIFIGDHGPDGQGQLFTQGIDWDAAQRRERFGTFFAARVPGCDMTGIESLVNVGRRVLSCLGRADLPDLPLHVFDLRRAPDGSTVAELELSDRG